ncbi:NADH-quinone oxidoreductase subunit A [Buchnera aphidicola]|uniref:NADH-quinone oxidoreductase subunit A n=1 Tax=Buchnera aphidicola TaxID=9 RepID=UPI0034642D8F
MSNSIFFSDLFLFFIFIFLAFFICFFILSISFILGERKFCKNKNLPFESGVDSIGNTSIKFSVKFYLIGIIFVIFDIEALYIYIWSVNAIKIGIFGLLEIFSFILMLLFSLFYVINKKVLDRI